MLAKMVRLELRALPGIGAGPATRLGADAFEVKTLDRADLHDPARYTLVLREPIGLGQRVTVRLTLSQDQAAQEAVAELRFATAEPFRPVALGCDGLTVSVSPEGTVHPAERPLKCTGQRAVRVSFTSALGAVSPVDGRNLVRFEPAVDDLVFQPSGTDLVVRGSFLAEVPYRVSLAPSAFVDSGGRTLEIEHESAVWLYFGRREPFLRWSGGQGVAERFGPKRVPADGRGIGTADLRIYAVDPLNRSLWPFPAQPVLVDESVRPPGPGEEPPAWQSASNIGAGDLQQRLQLLGSPAYSGIVDLPLDTGAAATGAHFGVDVSAQLARISGTDAPGHYLVGLRRLDGGQQRSWVRLQVTDLALTTIEGPEAVTFEVTSLKTGAEVSGARIRLQGASSGDWRDLYQGRTDGDGRLTWAAPGTGGGAVQRIVVDKGDDVLVIDPSQPPDRFADGAWLQTGETWLQWAFRSLDGRSEAPRLHGHLFPDRPMVRPGDEVHLKGYVRTRHLGHLSAVTGTGTVVVTGPGGASWRLPVELSGAGSYHAVWREDEPPTGGYRAHLELADGRSAGQTTFQVEAYRLPTFEVLLDGPDGDATVPNDRPFDVGLSAAYYAGGPVAARPVRWRVTQFPLSWTPAGAERYDGFVWSSDDRYARGGGFRATPALSSEGATGADGGAQLSLDPGVEADARPRTYAVEATVTGADEQTVTDTLRIDAVPAFVLGLKAPRYLPKATSIPVEVVALGPDGQPVPDLQLTVRTIQRQWHSVLQATDFTAGEAQYLTDVVDVPRDEQAVRSSSRPSRVAMPVGAPGVYWVEVEARDQLGRVQVVRLDLYAGGDGAVGWEKAQAGTFAVTPDRDRYRPGQTATLVLRSPFQEGRALVVVEAPERNLYREVVVRGGQGTVQVPIETGWVPRIPVHVVLRRGRTGDGVRGNVDLGKPQTVAATQWLAIEPVENRVQVTVTAPERALPGATVPVTVALADPDGKPLSGEVALWLVDQAVLALAPEQRLDPLPDFVDDRGSRLSVRDTRNQVLGSVPTAPMPGGDGGDEEEASVESTGVLDNVTVRKDLKAVPYYEPALTVGASGKLTVQVKLPDNLTVFKIRAKAVSGTERFGAGKGQIAVRLPVVVQPALPRFVRPGDQLDAAALVRVVEGSGGAGAAEIAVTGMELGAPAARSVTLDAVEAVRVGWPVIVETPPASEDGTMSASVSVKVGVRRTADGAGDAIDTTLPVRDDRLPRYVREIVALPPGAEVAVDALPEAARPGSVRRTVVVGRIEGTVRMAAALDVMRSRAPRGTDEIPSRARGGGARRCGGRSGSRTTRRSAASSPTPRPGCPGCSTRTGSSRRTRHRGRVWLTADALRSPTPRLPLPRRSAGGGRARGGAGGVAAQRLPLLPRRGVLVGAHHVAARLAAAGRFDASYFSELARNVKYLDPEAQATTPLAAHRGGKGDSPIGAAARRAAVRRGPAGAFRGAPRYAGSRGSATSDRRSSGPPRRGARHRGAGAARRAPRRRQGRPRARRARAARRRGRLGRQRRRRRRAPRAGRRHAAPWLPAAPR
ncbi:MAG: alpha-2-macroglobulin family protein [Myxococcota bacterium]